MKNEEELQELLKEKIIGIKQENNNTIIFFENGESLPLSGYPIELNIPKCSFCQEYSFNDPLFTINDDIFICKNCTTLAVETFLKNNIDIQLKLQNKK